MFGSSCMPGVHGAGSSTAIGAALIGNSPPTWSDCVLDRYGQKSTVSESETPAGQLGSGTGPPLTGFSGTGGFALSPGAATFAHTAGPGVGSVTVPVRSPHQLFCACTGAP